MLSRRTGSRYTSSIWTGFVDAMTALLLVLIFLITIFIFVQFVLTSNSAVQESTIINLEEEIRTRDLQLLDKEQELSSITQTNARLASEINLLQSTLSDSQLLQVQQFKSIEQIQIELAQAQQESIGLNSSIGERDQRISSLQARLIDEQSINEELSEQLEQTDAQLSKLMLDHEALQSRETNARASIASQEATISKLQNETTSLKQELVAAIQIGDQTTLELQDLLSSYDEKSNNVIVLSNEIVQLRSEITELNNNLLTRSVQIAELTTRLSEMNVLYDESQQTVDNLGYRFRTADAGRLTALQEIEQLRLEIQDATRVIATLNASMAGLDNDLKLSETTIENRDATITDIATQLAQMSQLYESSQRTAEELGQKYQSADAGRLAALQEIEQLRLEIQKATRAIASLNVRVADLDDELEISATTIDDRDATITDIATQLAQMSQLYETTQRTAEELGQKYQSADAGRLAALQEIEQLRLEIQKATRAIASLNVRVADLDDELGISATTIDDRDATITDIATQLAQMSQLYESTQRTAEELGQKYQSADAGRLAALQEIEQLRLEIQKATRAIASLNVRVADLDDELGISATTIDDRDATITDIATQLAQMSQFYESTQRTAEELGQKYQSADAGRLAALQEIEQLRLEIQKATRAIANLNVRVADLSDELRISATTIDDRNATITDITTQLAQILQLYESTQRTAEELGQKYQSADAGRLAALQEIEQLRLEIQKATRAIANLNVKVAGLDEELMQSETTIDDRNATITDITTQLAQILQLYESTQRTAEELGQKYQSADAGRLAALQEIEQLRLEIQKATRAIANLNVKVAGLDEELMQSETTIDERKVQIVELSSRLAAMSDLYDKSQISVDDLGRRYRQTDAERLAAINEIDRLREELKTTRNEVINLNASLSTKNAELESSSIIVADNQTKLEQRQEFISELRTELDELLQSYSEAQLENDSLKQQLVKADTEQNSLSGNIANLRSELQLMAKETERLNLLFNAETQKSREAEEKVSTQLNELATLRGIMSEFQELLKSSEEESADQDNEISNLVASIQFLETQLEQTINDLGQQTELRATREGQINELETRLSFLENRIEQLQIGSNLTSQELAVANDRLQVSKQENKQLTQQLQNEEQEKLNLSDRIALLDDNLTKLRSDVEYFQKLSEDTKIQLISSNEILVKFTKDLELSENRIETKTQEMLALQDTFSQSQEIISNLEHNLEVEANKSQLLDDQIKLLQTELGSNEERFGKLQIKISEDEDQIKNLNIKISILQDQLSNLQMILSGAEERDDKQKVQLFNIGERLNQALAQAAADRSKRLAMEQAERKRLEEEAKELERFRSRFLADLRNIVEGQEGVQIVGDRFVFSSEVLFEISKAELSQKGKQEIKKVANKILELSSEIPQSTDWVLRVDGHTDNRPVITTETYADNWELSQARALSVVRYLIDELDFPPERLAANAFSEYRPVSTLNTEESQTLNRRIEFKLTEP